MSTIDGAIEALKTQRHPFHYCTQRRGARRRSWFCVFVCGLVFLARRHGGTDSTHSTLGNLSATCRQRQAMSPKSADNVVCRRHVADMSATFPTSMPQDSIMGWEGRCSCLPAPRCHYRGGKVEVVRLENVLFRYWVGPV